MSNIVVQKSTMPKGWGEFQLGDIGKFFGGVTSIKKNDYGHGHPFLQYTNVYKNWKVDIHNLELMNVKKSELVLRNCIYGDVFFTASSETNDEVAVSSVLLDEVKNLTYNGFCKRFRLFNFDVLLPEFARYLFRDRIFRGKVYQLVTGDVRFNISQESLASITLIIPTIPEQKNIAETLGSLGDKIDLLHRQNKTLESMAQTFFRKLFIKNNTSQQKIKVGDIVSISSGKGLKRAEYNPNGKVPVLGGNGEIGRTDKFLFNEHLIFTGRVGTLGTVHISRGKAWLSDNTLIIKPSIGYFYFMYFFLKNAKLERYNVGSTQPLITQSNINAICFPAPKNSYLEKFNNVAEDCFDKIYANQTQIHTLEKTRDLLLPKLISGKIKVKL